MKTESKLFFLVAPWIELLTRKMIPPSISNKSPPNFKTLPFMSGHMLHW